VSTWVTFFISATAFGNAIGVAFVIALFATIIAALLLAIGVLARNPKLWNIGAKLIFVGVIAWCIFLLFFFGLVLLG